MKFVPLSQLDTSNPGTWPAYYKIILWLLIIAAMAGAYFYFMRMPLMEEQEQLRSQIASKEDKFKQLLQETHDLNQYQKRFDEMVRILEDHLKYLPANEEVPELIDAVYDSAVSSSINFDKMFPLKDESVKYYDIKPIALEAKTGYANFAQFAQSIASLDRILNVSDIKILMNEDDEILDIKGTLQTYVYNFNFEELFKKHKVGVRK